MSRAHVQTLPVNRREISYYFLFGTTLLFVAMIAAFSIWMLIPSVETEFRIGNIAEYPASDTPYLVSINRNNIANVWLVNIDGQIKLFARESTYLPCFYAWNMINQRFEDPCHGSKYRLSGVVIGAPAQRDLDQYAYELRDGGLWIDISTVIEGACRQMPGKRTVHLYIWDGPGDPPLCEDM